MSNDDGCRVIVGIKSMAALLNVSPPTISMYIKMGMPGNIIGKTWHFHLDLVEQWFKSQCSAQYKGETEPQDIEED
jgi:predicted transcriptional regulator